VPPVAPFFPVIERNVVDRYVHQGGVKDQLVAEREVVVTALFTLLAKRNEPLGGRPRAEIRNRFARL
jgi:hypothetical protein